MFTVTSARRYFCNLLVAASVIGLQVPVVFLMSLGLCSNWRGGRGQDWRAQQVLSGAQIVLLHRTVEIGLLTGTVHRVVTGVEMRRRNKKRKL